MSCTYQIQPSIRAPTPAPVAKLWIVDFSASCLQAASSHHWDIRSQRAPGSMQPWPHGWCLEHMKPTISTEKNLPTSSGAEFPASTAENCHLTHLKPPSLVSTIARHPKRSRVDAFFRFNPWDEIPTFETLRMPLRNDSLGFGPFEQRHGCHHRDDERVHASNPGHLPVMLLDR